MGLVAAKDGGRRRFVLPALSSIDMDRRMTATLPLADELVRLAREYLRQRRPGDAAPLLRRALNLPEVRPAVVAEANYLLAQLSLDADQTAAAADLLDAAIALDPENSAYRSLLAEVAEPSDADETLVGMADAADLAPTDPRRRSTYGLRLTQSGDRAIGLALLEDAYAAAPHDPQVVRDFATALLEDDRLADAELIVARAAKRRGGDMAVLHLQCWFRNRVREDRLEGRHRHDDHPPRDVIAFRRFGCRPTGATPLPAEPDTPRLRPVAVDSQMSLDEILLRSGSTAVRRLYDTLGLLRSTTTADCRRELVAALRQHDFLASLVARLPEASRRLLATLVQAGGYVPAAVVFQNVGADAPPPDHAQPLVRTGLLFFGRPVGHRRFLDAELVCVIPADVHERLAAVLGIDLDEEL